MAYEKMFPCPKCGSKNTGTTTIATSEYWIQFECYDCGQLFRKKAALVSPLSATLSNTSKAIGKL